jgi:putative membrane protein
VGAKQMLRFLAILMVALVAALHYGFMALEMFYWTKPLGLKVFHLTEEIAASSQALAANQGLYNGFLATGLVWSLFAGAPARALRVFFLGCVITAGVYGALTANMSILFVQALPGALALALVLAARKNA